MKTLYNQSSQIYKYKFLLLISIASLFGSCCSIKVPQPAKVPDQTNTNAPEPSYLGVEACISNADFIKAVKENVNNPIVKDDKPVKVVAEILATKDVTFNEIISVLVKPFEPGYWKDVATRTWVTVREAVGCWLRPWKWGTCWENVTKEVWTTTKVYVDPVAAVYELQTVAVLKIVNEVYKPEITIHYPTYLDDIKISFKGNKYMITGYTNTNLKLDLESKVIPLTPEVKIKSLLALDVNCEVVIEGDITITNDKKIVLSPGVSTFDIKTPMDKLPTIGGKEFSKYLFTDLALASITEKLVEQIGKKSLQKSLDKMLEQNTDKLNFAEQIDYATQAMSVSKELSAEIWLNLKPLEISCSNPYGSEDNLCINVGLKFEPTISYSQSEPDFPPSEVAFKVAEPHPNETNINLKLSAPIQKMEEMLSDALNNELKNSDTKILKSLVVEKVSMYRTENNKTVIAIDVTRKRFLCNCNVFSAYLVADLSYDNDNKKFALKNVDFSLDTRNKLINTVYKKFLDQKMEDYIEQHAVFDVEPMYKEANQKIENLSYTTNYGLFSGNLVVTGLLGPYVNDSTIDVIAQLKGNYKFQFLHKKPALFLTDTSVNKMYENLHLTKSESMQTEGANSQQGSESERYNLIASDLTSKKATVMTTLPLYDKNKEAKKKSNKEEEFIFVIDSDGNKIKKRKSFEDQLLPGETIIIMDSDGTMKEKVVE
jgi:hypothetical protein